MGVIQDASTSEKDPKDRSEIRSQALRAFPATVGARLPVLALPVLKKGPWQDVEPCALPRLGGEHTPPQGRTPAAC